MLDKASVLTEWRYCFPKVHLIHESLVELDHRSLICFWTLLQLGIIFFFNLKLSGYLILSNLILFLLHGICLFLVLRSILLNSVWKRVDSFLAGGTALSLKVMLIMQFLNLHCYLLSRIYSNEMSFTRNRDLRCNSCRKVSVIQKFSFGHLTKETTMLLVNCKRILVDGLKANMQYSV